MAQVQSGSFRTTGYSDPGFPDHYVFSWSLIAQSIEGNYSDISWSLKADGGSTSGYYTIVYERYVTVNGASQSNTSEQTTYNGTTPFSGTTRIYHNADGTKSFSASAGGAFYYSGSYNSTGSGTWELPAIARKATITSAPDFNDEQNPTIYYNNQAGANVTSLEACISLTGAIADIPYRAIGKTGNSYTFNLTDAERNTLRNATKTSNSRNVVFVVKTVIGGNTFTHSMTKNFAIVNANPTLGTATYKDTNSITVAITQNNQRIIRNHSTCQFTIGAGTTKKGATISKYQVTLAETTKELTSAGTVNFGTLNLSSNATATVKIIDSRGNVATKNITVIVDDWELPSALITLQRQNNYYSETNIKVDANYSSLNNKNTVAIQYQYKKVSDKNFSALQNLTNNVQATVTLDNNFQWDIRVVLTDKIGETTYSLSLDRGMPIVFFDRLKSSMGINCFPTKEKSLEVKDEFYMNGKKLIDLIYPVGSIYMSVNNVSPQTFFGGTWETFATGRTLVGVDTSQTEFNTVAKTGGAKTCTLTVSQMPSHEGHMYDNFNDNGWVDRNGDTNSYYLNLTGSAGYGKYEDRPYKVVSGNEIVMQGYSRGGGQAHNNLQPYITCYMWKRTA